MATNCTFSKVTTESNQNFSTPNNLLNSGIDWGPKRDSLTIVIPITVLYATIFVTGVFGNITTCVVISKNKSMHTATNYYLFSLAVSDLLLLTCGLPPEMYSIWSRYPYVFGETFCVMQGFIVETSANATVLTITSFTIERYIAICHPFLSRSMSNLHRAIKFVMAIWILALCLAVPQAIPFGVVCENDVEEHCACAIRKFLIPHAFEVSTVVFFIVPMGLITILYILIGIQLRKAALLPKRSVMELKQIAVTYSSAVDQTILLCSKNGQSCSAVERQPEDERGRRNFGKNARATRHVIKMLIAVVVTFFVCWAPFHAQRLLAIYGKKHYSTSMIKGFKILTYVSGILYYLSTTINPLLYHIMSRKFRKAFRKTYTHILRRRFCLNPKRCCHYNSTSNISRPVTKTNSYSSSPHSQHNSMQYIPIPEDINLQHSKRPLVISFRSKKCPKMEPVVVLRSDL